ncbi:hypothetical protein Bca52824_001468 [Brassica carinata]|uniref:Uncharacterized protein n=1 Tax=Brassica carinata TaxID=52824 RepID=A0A8X7WG42_BRACI|nr:hypothetical protein Bca52824_001468 [Brassica carinata]
MSFHSLARLEATTKNGSLGHDGGAEHQSNQGLDSARVVLQAKNLNARLETTMDGVLGDNPSWWSIAAEMET